MFKIQKVLGRCTDIVFSFDFYSFLLHVISGGVFLLQFISNIFLFSNFLLGGGAYRKSELSLVLFRIYLGRWSLLVCDDVQSLCYLSNGFLG